MMTIRQVPVLMIAGLILQMQSGTSWAAPAPDAAIAVNAGAAANVRVFPNPWKSNQHSNAPVTFDGLPANSTVKIFTLSGHWVKSLEATSGKVTWDCTNDGGEKVASGVYLYVVTDMLGDDISGKIAIVK